MRIELEYTSREFLLYSHELNTLQYQLLHSILFVVCFAHSRHEITKSRVLFLGHNLALASENAVSNKISI